ncbi:hypothetical protein SAMN04487846_0928 [Microbacterium sp. cf046]|uniref:hypothetical protein n=1 Tax=Microbacterium sp. cf046 TaxID=1761803 RepID=UPI0008F02CE5|nr:hypothetical protein [Microbacterium sp. cf046]SFR94246.1 hypothetical protein SAMN04487846_0928 [Microbacterium sp. cf046]
MAATGGASGGPVRPLVALGLATVAFVALLIFGLGMVSLILEEDVVEVPGLGQIPGVFATAVTVGAFALVLWLGLRAPKRSYWTALWAAVACYLVYVGGMWIGALVAGGAFSIAAEVAGRIATTWFGAVVAAAAAVSAWGGIALSRTRAERPRWPWEDEFDE